MASAARLAGCTTPSALYTFDWLSGRRCTVGDDLTRAVIGLVRSVDGLDRSCEMVLATVARITFRSTPALGCVCGLGCGYEPGARRGWLYCGEGKPRRGEEW